MATPMLTPSRQTAFRGSQLRARLTNRCLTRGADSELATGKQGVIRPAPQWARDEHRRVAVELLPLVRTMALKIRKRLPVHVELDDLVGAGMLGLLDAVRKFDAQKRVKIESYARHRIRGAILDGLRTLDTASREARKKNKRVEQALRQLQIKLGRSPSDEEMAEALGVGLKKWHRLVQDLETTGVDWLRPMQRIGSKYVSEDTLVDENQKSQFELCYRGEQREIMNRALGCLADRDRQIIMLYHTRGMTMKQIGARFEIDESRVSQLHSAAMARLRTGVKSFLTGPRPNFHRVGSAVTLVLPLSQPLVQRPQA